jgi:hypothetical protein
MLPRGWIFSEFAPNSMWVQGALLADWLTRRPAHLSTRKLQQEAIHLVRRVVLHPVAGIRETPHRDIGHPGCQALGEAAAQIRVALTPDEQRGHGDGAKCVRRPCGMPPGRTIVVECAGECPRH